jgi:DNA helicase HerA-like ATPase
MRDAETVLGIIHMIFWRAGCAERCKSGSEGGRGKRNLLPRLRPTLQRLQIFDNPRVPKFEHASLVQPGCVSVIDLSDTDSPAVNNLVIADLLRGIQRQQEENFSRAQAAGKRPTPVVIIIEEAHEFLSAQRIHQMPVLFQQVARIAKRGRKRWLGLVFVTQLAQHLPDEVLGLINNFILHKIADGNVVERLRKSISGLDRGQWGMLPGLAPGQALVSLTHMTRPLLVSVDPAPCQLKLSE